MTNESQVSTRRSRSNAEGSTVRKDKVSNMKNPNMLKCNMDRTFQWSASLVLLLLLHSSAHGIVIGIPSLRNIAFSICDHPQYRHQVFRALNAQGSTFRGGMGFNARSFLNFEGDSKAINQMMREFSECPATRVTCEFKKVNGHCDWQIVHDDRSFHVTVNLNSDRVRRDDVSVPTIRRHRPPMEDRPLH